MDVAHVQGDLETRAGDKEQVQINTNNIDDINNFELLRNKSRRKHTRRGSKKNKPRKPRQKYKPYNKLTWDEKRKLGERDAEKAVRRRKELVMQKGRPIAPYNTTQYLMDEHDAEHETINISNYNDMETIENENGDSSASSLSSDEYFDKDFNEFYEKVHIDTLNSYSKEDLIKTVYDLESKIESLEKDANGVSTKLLLEENTRLTQEIKELKEKGLTMT